jgi:uridine kinase
MTGRHSARSDLATVAAERAAAIRARGDARPVVLLDGGSGAGKSTLATPLAGALGAQLVRLDDVYPGWDGLEEGSRAVWQEILPLSQWHRWSWDDDRRAERHTLDPEAPLLIEGCGALSATARGMGTFGIWIELDEAERHRRAIGRDGAVYEENWERWAVQEREFFTRERPDRLADIVLDGAALFAPGPINPGR